ncbi:hypothetical protein M407DRAFT_33177 [Tulasnella calospora MUT 4182]|uniref:Uncharacterized protein n=1 Tax=Tulasnella calospora MUT 4182 TaxID=1051891 RepID=A0A0C3Q3H6_9AGAM|nr:hypothetical protein M407DRAFT_33177 [Tulasnella calospora MUT 4182]
METLLLSDPSPPLASECHDSEVNQRGLFTTLSALRRNPPSYARSWAWKYSSFSAPSLWRNMDRVQVLGDEDGNGYGHTGCINALCWSQDGTTLVSSGDDCRICVWRPHASPQLQSDSDQEELFQTSLTLTTGHTNNVFSIKFLPYTADMRVVTCSADREVRVFDLAKSNGSEDRLRVAGGGSRRWYERPESQCCVRVINCHTRRVKRIVTEDSSDLFLTVSEDHTVRQHDLRTSHRCRPDGACPAPLVKLPYSLSALASSPIAPYYFVVAGEASFADGGPHLED